MNNWREDAQPVWPEVASATRRIPADTRDRNRRETQVFPAGGAAPADGDPAAATDRTTRLPSAAAETQLLRGIPRQSENEPDTELLSSLISEARTRPFPAPADRPTVRDPWQEDAGAAGHTHDPHEVTVQLDAVQLGDGLLRQAPGRPAGTPEPSSDGPVFVDASGRRSRRFRRIGMAVGLACAGYAVVIVSTVLSGNSNAPWLPVPGQQDDRPAGQVDTSPQPAEPAPPTGTGTTLPTGTPTAGATAVPSSGTGATAPGATAGPAAPDASADPAATPVRPTASNAPGTGVTDPTPAKPSAAPTTPAPDPTPTDVATTAPADPSGGTDGAGTDTVAEGQVTPQPVAESPAAPPAPTVPLAPSPEYVL
ncbi:hypothetical protein ACIF8T_25740 [Streptomyces sp. NPDC085946]|uniref:hypothetical protein n=1 Tax=Streptomyces sp. NPDC085946 TaxID=3365744 RepID=UPI0037D355CB